MRRYIGLHIVSILLTLATTIFCGIFVFDYLTASTNLEQALSISLGIVFAVIGAGVYFVAMIFGAIGWGLSKRQGSSCGLFAVETMLPIVLAVAVFVVYLI